MYYIENQCIIVPKEIARKFSMEASRAVASEMSDVNIVHCILRFNPKLVNCEKRTVAPQINTFLHGKLLKRTKTKQNSRPKIFYSLLN